MGLIHLAHELDHALLMLVNVQGKMVLVVTHPLEFSTEVTKDRTVRALFGHVRLEGRGGNKLVATNVATGDNRVNSGKMDVNIILVYGTRAHGTLLVKNTCLDVLLLVDDAVLRSARTRRHAVETLVLYMVVKAVLCSLKATPRTRMKAWVIDRLVHGHVGKVLFIRLMGSTKLPGIPYRWTKKAFDFFFPLAIGLIQSDVLPRAHDAHAIDGMTPRSSTRLRTR